VLLCKTIACRSATGAWLTLVAPSQRMGGCEARTPLVSPSMAAVNYLLPQQKLPFSLSKADLQPRTGSARGDQPLTDTKSFDEGF
jgi:hypothetical protein